MPVTLYTIGYQGSDADTLAQALRAAGVKRLIDVRAVALSRKKGFSKHALAALLREYGIEYIHLKALGTPKPGREAAHAGDAAMMERIFRTHMQEAEPQLALARAAVLIEEHPSCLLCFEADPACCHRTIIADMLAQRLPVDIVPLKVNQASI